LPLISLVRQRKDDLIKVTAEYLPPKLPVVFDPMH